MIYRTKDGDVLDKLCRTQYGDRAGMVEVVLDANPGLATLGPVYASGTLITFPDAPTAAPELPSVRLWD